jgi:hypothetical protein
VSCDSNKNSEEISFVTNNDGIILQKSLKKALSEKGNIFYRKKLLNLSQLKRSLFTSMIRLFDETY